MHAWDPESESRYEFPIEALGIEPHSCRRACVAFNALPYEDRKAFYAIVLQRVTFNRFVAEGHGSVEEVKRRLMRAARALGLEDGPRRAPPAVRPRSSSH